MMQKIDLEHIEYPAKGVVGMTDFLLGEGYKVGLSKVRRMMRLMGIMSVLHRKHLSKLGSASYIKPYLLRGLEIDHRNQVWSIDITYIPMKKGFMYLTAIIDVYSLFIVGWSLHNSLDASHCIEVLQNAIATYGAPEIINSDQGCQFTCKAWIERFWETIKYEYIYIHPEENGGALYSGIKRFIDNYNYHRRHQGIDRQVPIKLYIRTAA